MRWVIAVPLVIVASCGASPTSGTPSPSLTVPLPSTNATPPTSSSERSDTPPEATVSVVVNSTPGTGPLVLPTPVEVTEPCPESSRNSSGDASGMMAETDRLQPMIGAALAYGGEHPDEFGTYGLVWHSNDDASVFISFTGHLDQHRAALTDVVEFPHELIVCQVALPGRASQALIRALSAELAGRLVSVGQGVGPVEVFLTETEEAMAGELVARYGDAVRVTVGLLPYPLEAASSVCQAPVGDESPAGLEMTIVPLDEPLTSTGVQPVTFKVQLTNAGDAPIQFVSGTASGTILDANGRVVGSAANIAIEDVGIPVDLSPRASTTLPGVVGLASCDPRLGYALPPGEYQLLASVHYSAGSGPSTVLTPPTPITIA